MKAVDFQRKVLTDLAAIKAALCPESNSVKSAMEPRVVAPPPDTIPPTNPNDPPGIPGPIQPPPIDRTA